MGRDRGDEGIGDNTGILSSFGFSEAAGFQALQCCFLPACVPPTQGALKNLRLPSASIGYFVSSPPLLQFHT